MDSKKRTWAIEKRQPLAERFEHVRYLTAATEIEASSACFDLLVENGGNAVEARYRALNSLGRVWVYVPQFVENRPAERASSLEPDQWPSWLSPNSDYTEAGAEALRRRRMVEYSRFTPRCAVCGDKFAARTRKARFCSARCRQADYRRRKQEARIKAAIAGEPSNGRTQSEITAAQLQTKRATFEDRVCERCGERFSADGTQGAKVYCSNACKQAAYRARKKRERIEAELSFLEAAANG